MTYGLDPQQCENLRDEDVILVPMKVMRTNGHFDKGSGMKVVCFSPALDHRMREEREKGPQTLDIMSRFIHSVAVRRLRVGDWAAWGDNIPGKQGKIIFIDGDEAALRLRVPASSGCRNLMWKLSDLRRILPPEDLTDAEKKVFSNARA